MLNRRSVPLCAAAFLLAAFLLLDAPRAGAQSYGSISGTILDVNGKPWPNLPVQIVSDQGAKQDSKTDNSGKFAFHNLRSGIYQVFLQLPAPNQPYQVQASVRGGEDSPVNLNFKNIVASQGKEYEEAVKKQEEEKQKFAGMKQHFDAGVALLDQAGQVKAKLRATPADQRDALKQQMADLSGKAVTELEAAKTAAPEKDPNLSLIWARLADAYDDAGRTDDAINAYKQAIAAKPMAAYYTNLGGIQGRAGKVEDAMSSYQKAAELDPPNAAQAWRNAGITLYNANRLSDAVEPLQKALQLDPKSAQAWYLLGASLVSKMTTKRVGDKEEVEFAPGTVEAYQKALELDPDGTYGAQAKQGLDMLKQLQPGIETKVNVRKKRP
jgi:tetratricopeptide (TPR) repeat protein